MTDRCHNCDLPLATEDDHRATKPGERPDLCWSEIAPIGGRCILPSVDWRARALAAEAETAERIAAWIESTAPQSVPYPNVSRGTAADIRAGKWRP